MLEGGAGGEVVVDGPVLLIGRALGKAADDVPDLLSCKGEKDVISS